MQKDYFWYLLTAAVVGGHVMAWLASRLFAKRCYYTGVDHQRWWSMGVIGWATLAAYWCLLPGIFIVLGSASPRAWLGLVPGLVLASFVVLRFKRYWRSTR
ncbi:hypothetical protein [Lysobacter sp. Hz 25]|uniref:hypothetical protein n=1 Tax=Lysobacter sp. Hz 25 TaxID=3383698 RepID=UPI0038D3974C